MKRHLKCFLDAHGVLYDYFPFWVVLVELSILTSAGTWLGNYLGVVRPDIHGLGYWILNAIIGTVFLMLCLAGLALIAVGLYTLPQVAYMELKDYPKKWKSAKTKIKDVCK